LVDFLSAMEEVIRRRRGMEIKLPIAVRPNQCLHIRKCSKSAPIPMLILFGRNAVTGVPWDSGTTQVDWRKIVEVKSVGA